MTNTNLNTSYEDALRLILAEGAHKSDRTGTGTTSRFGLQMRFDLAEGFPLITTKKVHMKSIIHELLWFLNGDSNIKYLQDNNVRIWNEWRRPYTIEGRKTIFVQPRKPTLAPNFSDTFSISHRYITGSVEEKLAKIWTGMMKRCYHPSHHRYDSYGAQGVTVHPSWHNPDNFIEDTQKLPHWYYKKANWSDFELDKDYYGSGQYGPETSVWLHTSENNFYTKAVMPVKIQDAAGEQTTYLSQSLAAQALGLSKASLNRFLNNGLPTMLKGHNKIFVGYKFEFAKPKENQLMRLELIEDGELGPVYGVQWRSWPDYDGGSIDQISRVVEDIKNNPDSRRLLVSAWNVALVEQMALPPCHLLFQFYVADGKLSLQLYQRSADMFLGVPFNIASYSLLVHMVAQQTGLEVGEFIWTGGDCHIYDNHQEQVALQLSREPYPFPKLELTKKESLFDYTYEDFKIVDYVSHEAIRGAVAV